MDKRDLKQEETEHQTETQNSHRHHPYHIRGILEKIEHQLGTSLTKLKCDKKLTLQNPKFALCLKLLLRLYMIQPFMVCLDRHPN